MKNEEEYTKIVFVFYRYHRTDEIFFDYSAKVWNDIQNTIQEDGCFFFDNFIFSTNNLLYVERK